MRPWCRSLGNGEKVPDRGIYWIVARAPGGKTREVEVHLPGRPGGTPGKIVKSLVQELRVEGGGIWLMLWKNLGLFIKGNWFKLEFVCILGLRWWILNVGCERVREKT